jgi:hypothetical protein|tara:strand:+ start:265 stop:1200 length:936 start_codon:yes stop_codon:yes gene_type:complete
MANSFLTYTNDVLAKLNEVQLTSTDFSDARGIQIQAKNAVNQAIRYINQREFNWPFNAEEESKTLTAGVVKYSLPSNTKHIDYATFRIRKSETFGNEARHLSLIDYHEYLHYFIRQEDDTVTTTLSSGIDDDDTTVPVSSTSSFDSTGTIIINSENITYTGTTSTSFTGATRGAESTTAASHSTGATVAQIDAGGIPTHVFRHPDNTYGLWPFPDKAYTLTFDYFTHPSSDLSAHGDTTTIPDRFGHIIVDGAVSYVYLYRSEVPLYERTFALFSEGIKNMQTLLINRFDYVRSTYIPRAGGTAYINSASF